MTTYIIYVSENNGIRITAWSYSIDSFGILTFIGESREPIGIFNTRNIIGFVKTEEEYVEEPQNLQTV